MIEAVLSLSTVPSKAKTLHLNAKPDLGEIFSVIVLWVSRSDSCRHSGPKFAKIQSWSAFKSNSAASAEFYTVKRDIVILCN